MATKYILDPSGNIKKIVDKFTDDDGNTVSIKNSLVNDKELEYLKEVNQNTSNKEDDNSGETFDNFLTNVQLGLLDGENDSETFKNFITTKIDHDPSFGFIDPEPEKALEANFKQNDLDRTFKPFNSFTDTDRVFADEFEILTGFRLREGELTESASTALLMFTYFAEVTAKIAAVEAIVLANRLLFGNETIRVSNLKNRKLVLGKYDFTEYDIFTKYVFNVLNYPHESSNAFERIMAYFIGFTEWLAPDASIDLNELAKRGKFDNVLEFSSDVFSTDSFKIERRFENDENTAIDIAKSIGDTAIVALITSTLQNTIVTALNHTSLNRVRLLLRKFYQERLFREEVLYSAKQKNNYTFGFFDDLNYYYFRFMIERIQVGLPFLKKYFYAENLYKPKIGKEFIDLKKVEDPKNRVFGQRSSDYESSYTISSNSRIYGHDWSSYHDNGENNVSTRITGIPQLLHKNKDFVRTIAMQKKDEIKNIKFYDETGDASKEKTLEQNFVLNENRKLSIHQVNALEKKLESEYMPFYIHDLRTNEVLSFHAFIESISDSFSPDYNPTSGFGRVDDVRTYTKTVRSINLTFILASTSKVDHDMMWYQINKIVSMCYPQWSNGYMANTTLREKYDSDSEDTFSAKVPFRYPFTQVPTASPLIRLRVGDVIKSNYSRTSLARLHGIGENTSIAFGEDFDNQKFKAVKELHAEKKRAWEAWVAAKKDFDEYESPESTISRTAEDPSFINLGGEEEILSNLSREDFAKFVVDNQKPANSEEFNLEEEEKKLKAKEKQEINHINKRILKHSKYLNVDVNALDTPAIYRNPGGAKRKIERLIKERENVIKKTAQAIDVLKTKQYYSIRKQELYARKLALYKQNEETNKKLLEKAQKIYSQKKAKRIKYDDALEAFNKKNDPERLKLKNKASDLKDKMTAIRKNISSETKKIENTRLEEIKKKRFSQIINPTLPSGSDSSKVNNPITISYESGMSKGLAGFITNLDISYNDSTWEIDPGSKAPMLVKINIGFTPIHDIPPGLDHNGMMRAPTYNVGEINKTFFGDPLDFDNNDN